MVRKENRIDRRVQRTRKLLWDALVDLILRKGYENVTIKDIIDEANIGRSTFYAHYENKEQLLFNGQPHFFEKIQRSIEKADGLDFGLIFDHARDNRYVARALFGINGGQMVKDHMKDLIKYQLQQTENKWEEKQGLSDAAKKELLIEAAASAIVSIISRWIEKEMNIDSSEMAELCETLVDRLRI